MLELTEYSGWRSPATALLLCQALRELRPRVDKVSLGVEAGTAYMDHLEGAEPLQGKDVVGAAVEGEYWHDVLVG